MIERRRLDKGALTAAQIIIVGALWLVSVSVFAVSIYVVASQLVTDGSSLVPLVGIGAILSFMAAVPTTLFIVNTVFRYLYYRKVSATLVVRTDRSSYRPGDDIRVTVFIDTDQRLRIWGGWARLIWARAVGEGGYNDDLLSVCSLLPWAGKELLHGDSYESTVTL